MENIDADYVSYDEEFLSENDDEYDYEDNESFYDILDEDDESSSGDSEISDAEFTIDVEENEAVTEHLQPYFVVKEEGFQEMMKTFNPNYKIPHPTTFSRSIIPKMYNSIKGKLIVQMQNEVKKDYRRMIYLMTDGYTTRSVISFMSLTLHYVTDDFEQKSFVLAVRNMSQRHTGMNINTFLKDQLKEYGLNDESFVSVWITDNAANMRSAIELSAEWTRIPCFDHTIHLAVKDAEKPFENLTTINPNCEPLTLIQDVPHRWFFSLLMLQRLVKLKVSLSAVSAGLGIEQISVEEWTTIDKYISVVSPIAAVATLMEGEKYPTISCYIPMILALLNTMQSENDQDSECNELTASFRFEIKDRFDHLFNLNEFSDNSSRKILFVAMMVDPRFKDRFLEDEFEDLKIFAKKCTSPSD
ncbi:zinc finger BED domain-containing protein 4-like [Trichogramma pretiosum]|uniref:zinc finger BED domain-containing protein 4-like n=1 Tax=Trichogramma pretiosum TaxID=7493 RepID=UPI0006C9DE92|nr:zinc finger BED domain-containing protein 4-like [Trichogramma pretiosum]